MDVNRDGHPDVIAGPFWYEGPSFTRSHQIYPAQPFAPDASADNHYAFPVDLDFDTWPDVLYVGFPGEDALWFENPGSEGAGRRGWQPHLAFEGVDGVQPRFTDLTGDGRPELVCHTAGLFGWVEPDWLEPRARWSFQAFTAGLDRGAFQGGIAVADVDGDGRRDVLDAEGWWRQPERAGELMLWEQSSFPFVALPEARPESPESPVSNVGPLAAVDLTGDGACDLVVVKDAARGVVSWFESQEDAGIGRFRERSILTEGAGPSELHALTVVDVNGDGRPDFVTGERFATSDSRTPRLFWLEQVPGERAPRFELHTIHSSCGAGVQIAAGDLNGDGRPDLVTAGREGTFVHLQRASGDPDRPGAPETTDPARKRDQGESQ